LFFIKIFFPDNKNDVNNQTNKAQNQPNQGLYYGNTTLNKSSDFGEETNQFPYPNFNSYNVYNNNNSNNNNPYSSQVNPYSHVNQNFQNFSSNSLDPHNINNYNRSTTSTNSPSSSVSSSLPSHEQNVLNEYIKKLSNDHIPLSSQEENEIVHFLKRTSKKNLFYFLFLFLLFLFLFLFFFLEQSYPQLGYQTYLLDSTPTEQYLLEIDFSNSIWKKYRKPL
jgi:hypothetical protein